MALIKSYRGLAPKWGRDCYFSENATIVGDVTMGDECSVWFNAVVRGDVAPITIGNCTNIQDGSCVHVTHETGPTHIGNYVTIGHNVTVHACTIHDNALIGMGSTLLDGCEVGWPTPNSIWRKAKQNQQNSKYYLRVATTYSDCVPMRNFPPQMPMPDET